MGEWVFFDNDQLIACFLVDELGMIPAKEALRAAIKVLHHPWPAHTVEPLEPASTNTNVLAQLPNSEIIDSTASLVKSAPARWTRRSKTSSTEVPRPEDS